MRRIVLTGGPGAGKTVISRAIADRFASKLVLVPEAATQVYCSWQRRRDQMDRDERREVQRQIYALQLRQEASIEQSHPNHVLLLDRGTGDGACYWPDGVDDYWAHMNTTHAAEVARYDAVIWLQSGAALGVYDGTLSNSIRWEDAQTAIAAGEICRRIWSDHPKFFTIQARETLETKTEEVLLLIDTLIGLE